MGSSPAIEGSVHAFANRNGSACGWKGQGYYETQHIDRLAAQGMRLTCHHHCQNCTPTRAALMSGQVGARTGVYTVGGIDRFDWSMRPLAPVENVTSLPLDRDTIADQLKAAGYATGMFGKWHIGEKGDHHPARRGFDEAIVSMGKHFDFKTDPRVDHPPDAYLADFLTDRAVDFIRRHKDGPFLLYLPHFGVHSPFEAKPNLVARFKGRPPVGGHHDPTYAAMIASVDESVGRVMQTLDELGLAANTVVMFTSDNGGVGGYGRPDGLIREPGRDRRATKKGDSPGEDGNGVTDNSPLRSGKGSLYEGGIRRTRARLGRGRRRGSGHRRSSRGPGTPVAHQEAHLRGARTSLRHGPESLFAMTPAGVLGSPAAPDPSRAVHRTLPGCSVRTFTYSATSRVPAWSPRLPRFRRGRLRVRTPAPRRLAATSDAVPRRRRSTRSWRSASRAGSRIAQPASTPSRHTSKRSFAGISRAGCSASDSPALSAHGARRSSSSPSRASGGACVPPATAGTWRRRPPTSSIT